MPVYSYNYTYSNGNITQKTYAVNGGTPTEFNLSYNSTANWKDQAVTINGENIVYDVIGNPTQYRGATLTWENGRQLKSYTKDEQTLTFDYDSEGKRIKKTLPNGVYYEYIYSDGVLTSVKSSDFGVNFTYITDESGNYIGFKNYNTMYYFVRNLQNDVVAITDANGNVIVRYEYDPWGVPTIIADGENYSIGYANMIRYRGYFYDVETGLYYLQSRYYDPSTGRFLNADAVVSGVGGDVIGGNMYAYCFNNPINMEDPSGNWPKWAKKLAAAAAVVAVTAAVAAVTVATAGIGTAAACVAIGAAKGAAMGFAIAAVSGAATSVVSNRISSGSWKGSGEAALNGAADGALTGAITGAVTGGLNSNVCFVAGTAILTAVGYVAIEDIRAGDKVWAGNPETGEIAIKEVVQTFVNETDELVHLFVNGEEIITTPEHPFYIPVKGWTRAISLRAGDVLVLQNGEYVVLEKIQHEILESSIKVYNFEVADFHTYFVGHSSILVHNVCGVKNTPDQDAVIQLAKSKRKGISMDDAKILVEWAKEYNIPGNPRIDIGHVGRGVVSQGPHAHIGPVNHIKIFEVIS